MCTDCTARHKEQIINQSNTRTHFAVLVKGIMEVIYCLGLAKYPTQYHKKLASLLLI